MTDMKKAAGVAAPTAQQGSAFSPSTDESDKSPVRNRSTRKRPRRRGGRESAKSTAMAREWADRNPDAWGAMVAIATEHAAEGRRIGTQDLIERIRWHDFTSTDGTRTRINNNLSPALARLLVAEHPEVAPYVHLRKSKFDAEPEGAEIRE